MFKIIAAIMLALSLPAAALAHSENGSCNTSKEIALEMGKENLSVYAVLAEEDAQEFAGIAGVDQSYFGKIIEILIFATPYAVNQEDMLLLIGIHEDGCAVAVAYPAKGFIDGVLTQIEKGKI